MLGETIYLNIEVSPVHVLESLSEAMTHDQAIEAIMTLDANMADMDASITVLDKLLGSLREEVKAGEAAESALARFDALRHEMITLLKAGLDGESQDD